MSVRRFDFSLKKKTFIEKQSIWLNGKVAGTEHELYRIWKNTIFFDITNSNKVYDIIQTTKSHQSK